VKARPLEARAVRLPPDARFLLAYAGKPADTRELVQKVRGLRERDPAQWQSIAGAIDEARESLAAALEAGARDREAGASDRALAAVRAGREAMRRLGDAAGTALVTPELARACQLADQAGAAGKPSGAGGGDCAIVLAFGDDARVVAETALRREFHTLRVAPA
jgi:phosphomevalonate kinase